MTFLRMYLKSDSVIGPRLRFYNNIHDQDVVNQLWDTLQI